LGDIKTSASSQEKKESFLGKANNVRGWGQIRGNWWKTVFAGKRKTRDRNEERRRTGAPPADSSGSMGMVGLEYGK